MTPVAVAEDSGTGKDKDVLSEWDYVAVAAYFMLVLAAGLYSMCRTNRSTVNGYFLAGRYMIWVMVGSSLFASNIGSEHFVGLAGSGAAGGIGVGAFEFNALILLQLLGWVMLPVYISSGVCTLPEFMKKRFGGRRIRVYLACLSMALYVFTKVSVNMYSGALFIQQSLGWNLYISIFALLFLTALCTVTGGLAAVIYTDTLQAFIMVAGASVLAILSFIEVGGYSGLRDSYMRAVPSSFTGSNSSCGLPRADSFTMLRHPLHSDMPWPAFLLGQTPASIWYWCADQMMVQRVLAAKSLSHAQGGTLFAGYLKVLPLFLIVMPGMISRVIYTDDVACATKEACLKACGNPVSCYNIAYPKLVMSLMPTGVKGVMLAVMLAALMSDLTSIFNSASTLFTMDIWRRLRKRATTRELLLVGRVFVLVMVAISIVWVPVIQEMQGGQLFIYIQVISAQLAPPIAAVYLLAILWKRCNEKGAFAGLMLGLCIGVCRMVLEMVYSEPGCGEQDDRPLVLSSVHYMYFAMILFWVSMLTTIIVSLMTDPPPASCLHRTTFWTRYDTEIKRDSLEGAVEMDDVKETLKSCHDTADGFEEVRVEVRGGKEAAVSEGRPVWRRGWDWFCGYNYEPPNHLSTEEMEAHLLSITSLQQDSRTKLVLDLNLLLILATTLFLYGFFSI